MADKIIKIQMLGQVGLKLTYLNATIFIDPYLSNYVEKKEGKDLRRLIKIPIEPSTITDANFVLITHGHIDHCDPETIIPIAKASPKCRFICSAPVSKIIRELGIADQYHSACYY